MSLPPYLLHYNLYKSIYFFMHPLQLFSGWNIVHDSFFLLANIWAKGVWYAQFIFGNNKNFGFPYLDTCETLLLIGLAASPIWSLKPHSQTSIINSTKMMIMTTGWVFVWGSWISVLNQGAIAENPAGPTPTWTSRINTLSASSLATSSELSKTTSSKCFLSQFA